MRITHPDPHSHSNSPCILDDPMNSKQRRYITALKHSFILFAQKTDTLSGLANPYTGHHPRWNIPIILPHIYIYAYRCWLAVCIIVVVLCVLLSSYVYLLYYVCIAG